MRKLALFSAAFSAAACVWAYGWWPLLPLVLLPGLRKRPGRGLCCALLCAGALAGLLWCVCYDQIFRAPARELEGRYPYLKDKPWLLPGAWVQRLARYAGENRGRAGAARESVAIGERRVALLKKYGVIP